MENCIKGKWERLHFALWVAWGALGALTMCMKVDRRMKHAKVVAHLAWRHLARCFTRTAAGHA